MPSTIPISQDAFMYQVHHIFLPPKLPQKDDFDASHEQELLKNVLSAMETFKGYIDHSPNFEAAIGMVRTMIRSRQGGFLSTEFVNSVLLNMKDGDCLGFCVRSQNFGLLLTRVEEVVRFEGFELLASNSQVIGCKGRLRRTFPNTCVELSFRRFKDPSFPEMLADLIVELDRTTHPSCRPKAAKAKKAQDEVRETVNPNLLFMVNGILRGLGDGCAYKQILKHSREETLYHDSKVGWHRSACWLFLRVSLQLALDREETDQSLFKELMAFLMGTLLEQGISMNLPSHLLHCMLAKVNRRHLKLLNVLGSESKPRWVSYTLDMMQRASSRLQETWSLIQKDNIRPIKLSKLEKVQFDEDTRLSLANLKPYLDGVSDPKRCTSSRAPSDRNGGFAFSRARVDCLPSPSFDGEPSIYLQLIDFENWVSESLQTWLTSHASSRSTWKDLSGLLENYHSAASKAYDKNPINLSHMWLTSMELWVAVDASVVSRCGLLHDYKIGFPIGLLEPLTLVTKDQMTRLRKVEEYLSRRDGQAKHNYPQAFEGFGRPDAFAARFYKGSEEHRALHEKILQSAKKARLEKLQELESKKRTYNDLKARHSCTTHDQHEVEMYLGWEQQCLASCSKCRLQHEMCSMKISVHEWPLPDQQNEAEAVVFELQVPDFIACWRRITLKLLIDMLKDRDLSLSGNGNVYYAVEHSDLAPFVSNASNSRLQLGSTVKPFTVAHYRNLLVSEADRSKVCQNHGCQYEYYDTQHTEQVSRLLGKSAIPRKCSFAHLSSFPVPQWIGGCDHTSNQVVAQQFLSPQSMVLEEFKAFGHIRSGPRLQWYQILTQLMVTSVDLNKVETALLFLQAAYQAGPNIDGAPSPYRDSHRVLASREFGQPFLRGLWTTLARVEGSWECEVTLLILSCLCTRLLSCSPMADIHRGCFKLLARIRLLSRRWVTILVEKWSASAVEADRNELNQQGLRMALVCISTYDVDHRNLQHILSTDEAITHFIEVSIIIHDSHNQNGPPPPGSALTLIGLQLWQRLCYRVQKFVSGRIERLRHCLDQAVRTFWQTYQPGHASWSLIDSETRAHILVSTSSCDLPVSLNLLDGSLLVDGRPLSRLPSAYQNHLTYLQLFGTQVISIVPSDQTGMEFSATRTQHGWTVHFAMAQGDLIIRAQIDDSIWEFIPPWKLAGDFPTEFTNSYSHWLNVDTGMVEFRLFDEPWKSGDLLWRTYPIDGRLVLRSDNLRLIDPESETAAILAEAFRPIEDSGFINIFLNTISNTLEINLCRYDLSFTLEASSSALRSKNHRGMLIDGDQSLQSLIGLQTRLILRPESPTSNDMRLVIIPQGALSSESGKWGHPVTRINPITSAQSSVVGYPAVIPRRKYDFFRVNIALGQLVDSGSLQSKLLLCHIHAATSHCLPDPLTCRTGTEQALRILRSAAMSSFERLTNQDITMLSDISFMSPRRRFYPEHLRVMQEIKWRAVYDPLAQNDEFFQVVQEIMRKGMSCEMFFPDKRSIEELKGIETDLAKRALIRNSTFRVDGFGAEHHTSIHDRHYRGRDQIEGSALEKLEREAYQITRNLATGKQYLLVQPLLSPQTLYRVMGSEVDGSTALFPPESCKFNHGWLDKPSDSIGRKWCRIQKYLSRVDLRRSKYDLISFFSALVFAEEADLQVIQVLLAIACVPALRTLPQPQFATYKLSDGIYPQTSKLKQCIEYKEYDFTLCPEFRLEQLHRETTSRYLARRTQAWKSKVAKVSQIFVSQLTRQWQAQVPNEPSGEQFTTYFNVAAVMPEIHGCFESWHKNLQLEEHLKVIISNLEKLTVDPYDVESYVTTETRLGPAERGPVQTYIAGSDLFSHDAPTMKCKAPSGFEDWCQPAASETHPTNSVTNRSGDQDGGSLADSFQTVLDTLRVWAIREYQHEYVNSLEASSQSPTLEADPGAVLRNDKDLLRLSLEQHVHYCSSQAASFQADLFKHLRGSEDSLGIAFSSKCFPRISPIFLLEQLNRHNWGKLTMAWRQCIVEWAVSLTHLQRAQRMLATAGKTNELMKEVKNVGHSWDPMEFPESLLLEVESGLMIRDVQEKIAAPMRNSSGNSCMQLNMGEGKSSVIVQIVAAVLANGKQLVRVLVAKPQSKQMRHMLITKLGGLLDRQVFFLPFSRSVGIDSQKIQQIQYTLETCMKTGGVLLVQPEHLLSLKLMGIESVGAKDETGCNRRDLSKGAQLIRLQNFMDTHSRDIVDESDENFSVKFELVYTIGTQSAIEMSPDRWIIIQSVLSLVQRYAPEIQRSNPGGVDLGKSVHGGQFATLRLLNNSATQLLLRKVAQHICNNGLHGLATGHQKPVIRQAVFTYITEFLLTDEASLVEKDEAGFFCGTAKSILLLLRGLFAGGVLAFAFGQKRWRVNYGLTSRNPPTMLAVPYRAKDSPAPRAEFSHPDMVIMLTCLSYYYGGLSNDELDICFEQLKRSDQAENEFASWAESSPALLPAFRQLGGVNLKDREQCLEHIFPALSYSKVVIDFYLHTITFPKEMVEFPMKLSASGWDLAKPKAHALTGFSGTCDSKYLLPLDIQHLNLPEQSHTNATVLRCLLRPENLVKNLALEIDSISLLEAVAMNDPPIDVILDVGALIIEMSNAEVARKWLELEKDVGKQATIFVNEEDELLVVNRQGSVEPFLTSPYARHTESCLVFLDEAHTRGIDISLPDHYRAATTLGPRLTKDRLVQACMRMRKLGKGQSVVFFIPHEIQDKIRSCKVLSATSPLTKADVLCWAISETWHETERSIPLWALQGLKHQRQEIVWNSKIKEKASLSLLTGTDLDEYFEDEAMSLEQRYKPKNQKTSELFESQMKNPKLESRRAQIELIRDKCERFEVLGFSSATLQEEQERELAPEIEQERQIENPPSMKPCMHKLHPEVKALVQQGTIPILGMGGLLPAFRSLHKSSAAQAANMNMSEFGQDLLVTADFARTVHLTLGSCSDAFHRSVHWILSLKQYPRVLVILSPWEANKLLPKIELSKYVHLHCYAPRPNMSFPTLQDLSLFTQPPLPPGWTAPRRAVMQMCLFAGELYFESMHEYTELCAYLGLSCVPNDGVSSVAADGFVGRGGASPECCFTSSPTMFLRALISNIRRDRQDISRTHVGRMLVGEILTEKEFIDEPRG
ncbi:uncharacterized protein BCR38DRAFT_407490 [Pseudomassariella vexata]|uniref:ubiquitinyl hydrolase 1 n=1 Tax=Pseudomassariella vexata TaxID=1141098 RepID=A0A1Y2E7V6_9PEZI|nr:uncharacterized protein BCR38DRAFT_407490 [Pseudomassariella vexata]ORY67517.1 hypothetical protein BCR38DRAFT_407490 [Pseudomassariella vexata]